MKRQSHKMTVTVDEHTSHLERLIPFFRELDAKGTTIETLPRPAIEAYQLEAINLTLAHVWENNAYYRARLEEAGFREPRIDSLEQLASVPLLTKDVIRGDKSKLLCVDPKHIGQEHLTSGTSGKPIYACYTLADQYVYDLLPKYLRIFDESDEDVTAVALPYEFALPGLGFQRLFQFAFGAAVLSMGKGGYMAPIDKQLELMKEFQATVLATTPSYAALLAEESEKYGFKPGEDIRLRTIWLTGEGCSSMFRERLERWWNCRANFFYGSTECGVVGVECKEHRGYHVMEGHVKVEIVDPKTGAPLPRGRTGEIVVTTLLREGMPMIRYRSGDLGFLQPGPCPCGMTMDVLHLRGRMEHMIRVGGEEFSPFLVEHFLMEIPDVGMWYRFIVRDDKLTIEAEPFRTKLDDAKLAKKIRSHMRDRLGMDVGVVIRRDIPRTFGKATRVIQ